MHRLSKAGYDTGGGVTRYEDFDYDDLGNRVTYVDDRNTSTTTYQNNAANEYSAIGNGVAFTTVHYDADGNLSRNNVSDLEYTYYYENRLTHVDYVQGGTTQMP